MHWLDWLVLALPVAIVLAVGIYAHRYMRSVAHFMSGGRLAGRYLLAVARGEMLAGAVVFVAYFEIVAQAGFTYSWWRLLEAPVIIVVAATGFVVWRFRETRAMTLAQFFELRYSKRFRVFAGALAVVAGVLNFGIIPAVGAQFFVSFLGLPADVAIGGFAVPTYVVLMGAFLLVSLFVTLSGGLVTEMVTDCVEGMVSQVFYLGIIAALVCTFSWEQIAEVLANRPAGQSLLNPFDSQSIGDFDASFVLMQILLGVYGTIAWQNASAYNSAGLTPHEARMSTVLGRWREMGRTTLIALLAVCAVTFLSHPDFAAAARGAIAQAEAIGDAQVRNQMSVPIALAHLLPIGIKGALCAILLLGVFGGDSTHLHSWGGIFVQDVLVPLRRKPFAPAQHIRALRLAVVGVAVFAFFFGCVFRHLEHIIMWWKVTMGVYIGGAGAAIIGGLYWKRGTTAGAWTGLVSGAVLSGGGILARHVFGAAFPLNGMQVSFFAAVIAIAIYVGVSWLTHREDFDMERMLHRGRHAATAEALEVALPPHVMTPVRWWQRLMGLDEHFTRGDKWIAGGLAGWSLAWAVVMLVVTVWNLIAPWPAQAWSNYWLVAGVVIPVAITAVTSVWFTWGGWRDIRALFRRLKEAAVDPRDNGMVVGRRNLDEADEVARRAQAKRAGVRSL